MSNSQTITRWVLEKATDSKAVEIKQRDGKSYVVINDYKELRNLFGQLLNIVQRIKSTGDFAAGKELIETYGVKIDPTLHAEVRERYKSLELAPYKGFVNPRYTPVTDENGNITDVTNCYNEGFVEQQLRYASEYSPLPAYND